MRCKECNKIIPDSVGECVNCNDGIPQAYLNKNKVYQHETPMD